MGTMAGMIARNSAGRTRMAMPEHMAAMASHIGRRPTIKPAPLVQRENVRSAAERDEMAALEAFAKKQREIARRKRLKEIVKIYDDKEFQRNNGMLRDYRYHPERVHRLMNLVAQFTKISVAEMKGKSRFANIVKGRFIAIWIVRKHCVEPASKQPFSLPRIGRIFGGRDHATILSALQKVERERELHETANQIERMVLEAERKLYGGVDELGS